MYSTANPGGPSNGALQAAWEIEGAACSGSMAQVPHLLTLGKAKMKMDMEGRPPPTLPAPPRPRHPAAAGSSPPPPPPYSLKVPTGRSGLWLLHPLHPGPASPPVVPLLPRPRARLRSPLGSQPWARTGSSRGLPPGGSEERSGSGRGGCGIGWLLARGCATKGNEAKPGAFQGRDRESGSGAQTGGERKGLEQRGLPRPASPPRHRLQQPEPQGASVWRTSEGGRAARPG